MVLGKHRLKQNEEAVLKIIYSTENRPGDFKKRIYLMTDIPDSPPLVITVTGTVHEASIAKIEVEPRKINVGSIERGAIELLSVTISNPGSKPLEINKISGTTSGESYFDRRTAGDLIIPPETFKKFEMPFSTDTDGAFVEVIFIESNARRDRYAIMVMGEVKEIQKAQ